MDLVLNRMNEPDLNNERIEEERRLVTAEVAGSSHVVSVSPLAELTAAGMTRVSCVLDESVVLSLVYESR